MGVAFFFLYFQISDPILKSTYYDASADNLFASITKSRPVKVATLKGQQEVKLRIRQNHNLPLPKVNV